jgi:phenylalanyl-tRNA synthetase beta chain
LRVQEKLKEEMKISYKWLCQWLPAEMPKPEPADLSRILTSIGLEVEGMEKYESVEGSLSGLIIGEIIDCRQHPNADKLKITQVDIGQSDHFQIVCGAPNVDRGQKVIVALPGTTIYPIGATPLTLKVAKIRGVDSYGMICAADEIGLGTDHTGIIILPQEATKGRPATDCFAVYDDHIIEIGLTPNHMDAMSHMGVARDVCAFISNQENKIYSIIEVDLADFSVDHDGSPIKVSIENTRDCQRYSGISIEAVRIEPSASWIQDKLKAIGVRPINNIVDITNYVLHELGQPLHAFDADRLKGNSIIVKNLPEGTPFLTLDDKERKLHAEDLMICDAIEPICIAGVFGGLLSGVTPETRNIFLESAWFNPEAIRKTSFRLGLRTDAASHFEKGMDISATVLALKRAAKLIKELCGGRIASAIVDIYPEPKEKKQVLLTYPYLARLSGKTYSASQTKKILLSLGFTLIREESDGLMVAAPYHKPDISLPADLVEEIMRIDGFDSIQIPASITITPAVESRHQQRAYRQKATDWLVGQGFQEILTNSITNSAYYSSEELLSSVRMINNLSAELNIMRPSLLETGLESLAYNINRKNNDLRFFEFGKAYSSTGPGIYTENNRLGLYVTGKLSEKSWKSGNSQSDFFYLKGICNQLLALSGIPSPSFQPIADQKLISAMTLILANQRLVTAGEVNRLALEQFDIRQPVFFASLDWDLLLSLTSADQLKFQELPKQLPVDRDLAIVVRKSLAFGQVEQVLKGLRLDKLQEVQLFDIFESEKLGVDKKSLAVHFQFLDGEKTLTDKEVEGMMNKIMVSLEKELNAEIRK